jgi:3-hydroxyisobutyrate dehydrogenase
MTKKQPSWSAARPRANRHGTVGAFIGIGHPHARSNDMTQTAWNSSDRPAMAEDAPPAKASSHQTGFIGLGAMGGPMARNLAKAGLLSAVWNRTHSTARLWAEELGVVCADSPADLAARVDVVLTCVSADVDLLAVIDALLPGLKPGAIVVDHSTVSSETARGVAERVRSKGADFLDAPVSGGVEGARNGTLAVMVGGRADSLERVRPVLEAMAARIVRMGDVGAGQATKAVNQIMCAGINQAVTEALAFGATQGLDMDKVVEVVAQGAAGNWFLDKRGHTMIHGSYTPGFKLALHQKDLRICLAMAAGAGMELPITTMTARDYAELMREGHGDEDISALYRLKRPTS